MHFHAAASWTALATLCFASLAAGQNSDAPSVENFVRRYSGAVVVIGNYAYLDGGEIAQMEEGIIGPSRTVNSTLSLDLSKSWALKDAEFKSTPKGLSPSKGNAGAWANRERTAFYVWGGKSPFGRNLNTPALYKFTVDGKGGGSWNVERPQNPNLFSGLLATENMAVATVNNTMYGIGGHASRWSVPNFGDFDQAVPGMITYDMDTRAWTNITGPESPIKTLTQGRTEYLPSFGPQGLVIVLGGHSPRVDFEPNITNSDLHDFQTLTFFDPVTLKVYTQIATGDIPVFPRGGFCMTSFQNKQGGHEIFIFGGENGETFERYKDAYVLSLPAFVWTKAPEAPFGSRAHFTCAAVGKSQVLTVGGLETKHITNKDAAPKGLTLFDMTSMSWKDSYDATRGDYERSGAIKALYSSGTLDKVQWSSKEVQSLFATDNGAKVGGGGSSSGGSNSGESGNSGSGTDPLSNPGKVWNTGAIAGGVVGGVLAVAAAVGVWFFLRRRRRRQQNVGAGIEYTSAEQPGVAEMAAGQGHGGHQVAHLPPGYGAQKYGPVAMAEADTMVYAEADGTNRYAELPSERMDRRGHVAELDGGMAPRR